MNFKKRYILTVLLLLLIMFVLIRFNSFYQTSFNGKVIMAGCMQKALESNDYKESKMFCECSFEKLLEKYGNDFLNSDYDLEVNDEQDIYINCRIEMSSN